MAVVALALLAGVICGLWVEPPTQLTAVLALALPALATGWWLAGPRVLVFGIGWCWSALAAVSYLAAVPGPEYRGRDVGLRGCVVSVPRTGDGVTRFLTRISGFDRRFAAAPQGRLLDLSAYAPLTAPPAGECFAATVRLKPPNGTVNPGQFDRERDLLARGIVATGYLSSPAVAVGPPLPGWHPAVLRMQVLAHLDAVLGEHPAAGLVAGLTVGIRHDVTTAQWGALRATGTSHLMAISGLHVGLVAGLVWLIAGALPVTPGSILRPTLTAFAALGYAVLAGWTVPTARAACMVIMLLVLRIARRHADPLQVLWLALTANLLLQPLTVLRPGFWLSYLAVALLLTAPPERGRLLQAIRAQGRLAVGLLAPSLALFGYYPLLAVSVNLIAIPVFGLLVLPLTLLACMAVLLDAPGGEPLLGVAAGLLQFCMQGLRWLADKGAVVPQAAAGPGTVCALLVLLGGGLWRRNVLWTSAAVAALVATAWLRPSVATVPLRVEVIDVGQGTAVLVTTTRHALLVDTGPAWRGGDAGQRSVLPLLAARGVTRLDAVLVSHADNDHSGGLHSVLAAVPVGFKMAATRPPGGFACRRGMQWHWDEVSFRVLHPAKVAGWSDNNASCVLLVRYRDTAVLLPGDIETAAEAVLVAREGEALRSVLVLNPHHGSNTSSSRPLVAATRPQYVATTMALWNRWGFPADAVVRRWQAAGACVYTTAYSGAMVFRVDSAGQMHAPVRYRAGWHRPWPIRPRSDETCAAS